jgi:hypothetical protein
MLVEDPVFSGDKEKSLPYSIQAKDGISAPLQQVSRNQYPVSLHYLHHNILKLDSDFKILVFNRQLFKLPAPYIGTFSTALYRIWYFSFTKPL